jgi:hypothetical protein
MASIDHKRGDTFEISFTLTDNSGSAVDLTNYTVRAMARDSSGTEQVEWTEAQTTNGVDITNAAAGQFKLVRSASSPPAGQLATTAWPLGRLEVDVEFSDNSSPPVVVSSDTFFINVLEDITRD